MSIHQRNLQLLLIEIYKTVNNLNPSFMAEVFVTNVVPIVQKLYCKFRFIISCIFSTVGFN